MSERLQAYKIYMELRANRKQIGAVSGSGFQFTSMQDQDGIINEIFKEIKTTNKTFIEFGAGDGLQNNTLALLSLYGWKGLWIEGDEAMHEFIEDRKVYYNNTENLTSLYSVVNRDNINELLGSYKCEEPDLLVIDTDWNDYYLWEALESIRPRVVVIEYNSHIPSDVDIVVPYGHNTCSWNGSSFYGASLAALKRIGEEKDYTFVGTNIGGSDAFFVRNDCLIKLRPGLVDQNDDGIPNSPWTPVDEVPIFDLCYQVGHKNHAWCNQKFVDLVEEMKKNKSEEEKSEEMAPIIIKKGPKV